MAALVKGSDRRAFSENFESFFQGRDENIRQLVGLVFQKHQADGFFLALEEVLDLVRHIMCPFATVP